MSTCYDHSKDSVSCSNGHIWTLWTFHEVLLSADSIFKISLFKKLLSWKPSKSQTVWSQIMARNFVWPEMGLIRLQRQKLLLYLSQALLISSWHRCFKSMDFNLVVRWSWMSELMLYVPVKSFQSCPDVFIGWIQAMRIKSYDRIDCGIRTLEWPVRHSTNWAMVLLQTKGHFIYTP